MFGDRILEAMVFTARVSFSISGQNIDDLSDEAHNLLSCWHSNGQIVRDTWPYVNAGSTLDAYVSLPANTSLQSSNNNSYATKALSVLKQDFGVEPTVAILGEDPCIESICGCTARKGLLLYAEYASISKPMYCMDCFCPVPLYTLPKTYHDEYLDLLHWLADYQACDTLQMHCTTGERFAEQQLLRHDSSLARNGRELAAKLEQLTGIPVYYFLLKMRGRSKKVERGRRCPACGGNWLLPEPLHDYFDFQCIPCRLLSHVPRSAR